MRGLQKGLRSNDFGFEETNSARLRRRRTQRNYPLKKVGPEGPTHN